MPGNGGIGGGSLKVYITDTTDARSEAQAKGGPKSHGKGRADAEIGSSSNQVTITFHFSDGDKTVTIPKDQYLLFDWQ